MTERLATTPFGGARVSVRQFARQKWIAERQAALSEGHAVRDSIKADKWQLLRALTEAREVYGLSDRSITVLEALASFHQSREIDGAKPIIVFPSNAELSLRTRGMSPATLRRHLCALVQAGLILRRDSPNGKRYCRRGREGEEAFGFDIAPMALMAPEIAAHAAALKAEQRERQKLRSEITIHLRDIAKTIAAAKLEARAGDWHELEHKLIANSGPVSRRSTMTALVQRRSDLVRLRAEVETTYLDGISTQEMSANVCDFERHIQNSNTEQSYEKQEATQITSTSPVCEEKTAEENRDTQSRISEITLSRVLAACPKIADYSKSGIYSWRDLYGSAFLVKSILGITPSAWEKARETMGDVPAAVVMAAILERAENIRSAGGYLRTLTQMAQEGKFPIMAMLKALEQRDERRQSVRQI